MSKTGTQLVLDVKGNIGDRSEGFIGSQSIDSVTTNAINLALLSISRKYMLPNLQRNVLLSLGATAYQYSLPVADVDGNTIVVRNILKAMIYETDANTAVELVRLSPTQQDKYLGVTSTLEQGKPKYYTIFSNKLEFHPYPDTTYYVPMRVNIWHTAFTSDNISSEQQLGIVFDDVIENYATMVLCKKLQQTDDALYWRAEYLSSLNEAIKSIRHEPDWKPSAMHGSNLNNAEYWLDPVYRR